MDKCFLGTPASEAVRNRKCLLLKILKKEIDRKEKPSILNLACGPAREIAELTKAKEYANRFSAINIDADIKALTYAKSLLNSESDQNLCRNFLILKKK